MVQPVVKNGPVVTLNEMSEPPTPGAYELFGIIVPSLRSSVSEDEDNGAASPALSKSDRQ